MYAIFLPHPRIKQTMMKRRSLVLPREIWSIIFRKLDTPTLRKIASLVCKDWLNIIRYLGNKQNFLSIGSYLAALQVIPNPSSQAHEDFIKKNKESLAFSLIPERNLVFGPLSILHSQPRFCDVLLGPKNITKIHGVTTL